MKKELINPPTLIPPRGFNHAIAVEGGRLIFLAGQDASDSTGKIAAPGDLVAQFEQVMKNLNTVMEAAGGSPEDIVKLNIFVRNRDEYLAKRKELGEIFRSYFGHNYPTMALFEVSAFYNDGAVLEMEGLAVLPSK